MMRFFTFLISAAVLTASSSALAVPKSPISIQEQLGLSYQPPCSVCHTSKGVPNSGDVTAPFGVSMVENGLKPNDRPAMNAALAALEAAHVDSDGDGFTDIAELRIGLDPSSAAVAGTTTESQTTAVAPVTSTDLGANHGCSAAPGPVSGGMIGAGVLLGLVGLFGLRRRHGAR